MWTEHRLISFDETTLFYRRCEAEPSKRGTVIVLHGMGEHGGRYESLAKFLSGRGLEAVIPDLRGFGRSGGNRACVRRFHDFHEDLKAIHEFVARNQKGLPLFLLGHSFGGLVASSYLAYCDRPHLNGLVLSSPIFGIAVPIPKWRHFFGIACSYLAPDYSQATRVRPESLTHDTELLAYYKEDPYIYQKISARLYRELVGMMKRRFDIAGRIRVPVLVAQAGEDAVVDKDETVRFFNSLASADKELELYSSFYHEILNETGREAVYKRIGDWILRHIDHN